MDFQKLSSMFESSLEVKPLISSVAVAKNTKNLEGRGWRKWVVEGKDLQQQDALVLSHGRKDTEVGLFAKISDYWK